MQKSNESTEKLDAKADVKKQDAPKKPAKKGDKKPNFFVRAGRKIKETFSELKRVTWPSLPQALKATGVVIVIVLIFLIVITAINFGFSQLLEWLTDLGGEV
mgnify:FL=1